MKRRWLLLVLGVGAAAAIAMGALLSEDAGLEAATSLDPNSVSTTPATQAPATTTAPAGDGTKSSAVFVDTVDGDTITTDLGTIRIIGIDTPERGECGYEDAAGMIEQVLAPGDEVTLELPHGQRDTDRYGRLLRYVITADGTDIGMMQIEAGVAVARYDSHDGYPKHPREAVYRAAGEATLQPDRTVQTAACAHAPAPQQPAAPPVESQAQAQTPAEQPAAHSSVWWTEYRSCSALKRNSVGHPKGPFNRDDPAEAAMYQWFAYGTGFNGDGDDDGLACE